MEKVINHNEKFSNESNLGMKLGHFLKLIHKKYTLNKNCSIKMN